jgi:lysophospholipase L1-like esterase
VIKQFIFICAVTFCIYSSCSSPSKGLGHSPVNEKMMMPDSLYPPAGTVIPAHSDWTKAHYPERIREFKKNPLNNNDIVFVGNSITEQGGSWAARFNDSTIRNRGISGDVTAGVLQRLGEIWYSKPRAVFILIGINDMWNDTLSAEYIATNIMKIAATIHWKSPHTRLYVQSILPTGFEKLTAKIKAVNDMLKSSAGKRTYSFIDLHSFFADEKDLIKKQYTVDGVHLTDNGYQQWVGVIKKYVK